MKSVNINYGLISGLKKDDHKSFRKLFELYSQPLFFNTLCTKKWRYTHYSDGGQELYVHSKDTIEWHNLAEDPEYAHLKRQMQKWLRKTNADVWHRVEYLRQL